MGGPKFGLCANLAALLWTISSLEILCSVDGDNTGEVYSRKDLTIDM